MVRNRLVRQICWNSRRKFLSVAVHSPSCVASAVDVFRASLAANYSLELMLPLKWGFQPHQAMHDVAKMNPD